MSSDPSPDRPAGRFATTCWNVVAHARDPDSPLARQSLAELCQTYWYPLYAFVRRRGYTAAQAEDLTQGFFADLLARDFLKDIDPTKGKFRSFLRVAMSNYLNNERDRRLRAKRGGGIPHVSIDFRDAEGRYLNEPSHEVTPERLFERRWALTLIQCALDRLEREMADARKQPLFERLKPALQGEADPASHSEIAAALGMTGAAVKQEAYRLRKRFRAIVRDEIGRTVAEPGEVDQEITDLFVALGS